MKISPWWPENEEDGFKDWSGHQRCHLCSLPKGCSHIPWWHLLYPQFRHHKEADVVADDARVITRHRSQARVVLSPSSGGGWCPEQRLFPERQKSYGSQPTPRLGVCWHLRFVTVSFAIHVTCSRYFMKCKISILAFFAFDIKRHTQAQKKMKRKRRNKNNTDKNREECYIKPQ